MAADTTPAPAPAPLPKTLVVADVADDGIFLELEDGRHVAATVKDGVNLTLKRGTKVAFTSEGVDELDAPTNVVITKTV